MLNPFNAVAVTIIVLVLVLEGETRIEDENESHILRTEWRISSILMVLCFPLKPKLHPA